MPVGDTSSACASLAEAAAIVIRSALAIATGDGQSPRLEESIIGSLWVKCREHSITAKRARAAFGVEAKARYGRDVAPLSLMSAVVSLHVLANVVWIGSLLAVALLLSEASKGGMAVEAARHGRRIYLRLSVPAFAVSLLCGAGVLLASISSYRHAPWMHAKLALAIALIAIHHVIGARARRASQGQAEAALGASGLGIAAFVCSAGVVWLAITRWLP